MDQIRRESEHAAVRWRSVGCGKPERHPIFTLQRIGDTSTSTGYNPSGVNANTISFNSIWSNTDDVHRKDTIAITNVTFDLVSGEIVDADIEMNENNYSFTTGIPRKDSADLPTILTHEIGHFHGLGHSSNVMAVMWFEAGLGEQRRQPTSDDVMGICHLYSPESAKQDAGCNPTPYGGWAINQMGGQVRGTCSVHVTAERTTGVGAGAMVFVGILGLRRRRFKQ